MDAELTVVVSARTAECLPRLLNSLCRQEYDGLRHVILLDLEHPTDVPGLIGLRAARRTVPEVAADYGGKLAIQIVPSHESARAAARNAAARIASAPYLLFLDCDVELDDRTLLRRAMEMMKQRQLHLAGAAIGCRHGDFADDLFCLGHNLLQRAGMRLYPLATAAFMLFDRAAFLRLGGFDEQTSLAEDLLLSKRVELDRFGLVRGRALVAGFRMRRAGHRRMLWKFARTMFHRPLDRRVLHIPLATDGVPMRKTANTGSGIHRVYGR